MKHLIFASLSCLIIQAGAQTIQLNTPEDWKVPVKNGTIEIKGRQKRISSEKLQKVNPAARYTLNWEIRKAHTTEKGKYLIGFLVYDEHQQEIQPYQVYFTPGSETVLTETAVKGSKTLKIQTGTNWKSGDMYCPAFHIKPEGQDIPNRDVLTGGIEKITPGNGYTELTLKRPLTKDYPAGTTVRQHLYQSSLFLKVEDIPNEWKKGSASLSGIATGKVQKGKWWPGTEYFRVMITSNIGSPDAAAKTLARNIELEIKGADSIF